MYKVERSPVEVVTDEKFLRQVSKAITVEECETLGLWQTLRMVMDKFPNGLALSAIQIGIPVRACLMVMAGKENEEELVEKRILNPVIIARSPNFTTYEEECISFPGRFIKTSRNMGVLVKDDINGENVYSELAGIVIQHEIDHMDGVLYFDRELKVFKREGPKIGRNDPCPCGSGKKYKRCCGEG